MGCLDGIGLVDLIRFLKEAATRNVTPRGKESLIFFILKLNLMGSFKSQVET